MLVGHIHSTQNDVTLHSPQKILDGSGEPSIDVSAVNITMTSGTAGITGGIGLPSDFLEINVDELGANVGVLTANDTAAPSTAGVFVTEIGDSNAATVDDLRVHLVRTKGDVSLVTDVNGSIIDANNDSAADVIGNTIDHMSDAVKRVFFGKGSDSLQVEGQDDLLVYRARCCNPIRGEEIIGYVTRGKGVAVHARSCPNVQNLLYESDRRIQVEWAPIPGDLGSAGAPKLQTYPVKLTILCDDRAGLLKEFTAIISDDGTNIRSSASDATADGGAVIDFVIETVDVRHLKRLVDKLRRVQGVRDVQRVQKI